MIEVGKMIVAARRAKALKQFELARRAEMTAAQLCQIENGRVSPSFNVVERIANALDTDIPHLIYGVKGTECSHRKTHSDCERASDSSLEPIRSSEPDAEKAIRVIEKILRSADHCRMPRCSVAFNKAHSQYEGAGVALAEDLRAEFGLGTAPVGDLVETLRFWGVRVLETRFAKSVGSVSIWDSASESPIVVLNSLVTAERKLYRLAYELGSVALFRTIGVRLDESLSQHRFLTDFTAAFLMPAAAVRTCVAAIGISPDEWTLNDVIRLKSYFGVSAESFALRLEELGLILSAPRMRIRDELRAYYRKHPKAMEPQLNRASISVPKPMSSGEKRKSNEGAAE